MSPRVHISCGFLTEEVVLELAPAVEAAGADGITLPDHLFLPDTPVGEYPYSADGRPPFRLDVPWPDAIVLAGAVGMVTSRVAITTAVHILPLRHPVIVGKAVATAARLCGGRFAFGVGVGWQREEFDAVDVPFERRGRRTDDSIEAMRALWSPGSVTHASPSFAFGPVLVEPKPPHIPILVGGASDAALTRAATVGDGWFAPMQPLGVIPEQLERIRAALAQAGRSEDGFRVVVPVPGASAEEILALRDPLISDLTTIPWPPPGKTDTTTDEKLRFLETWCSEVMEPLRAAW